ncbi:glutamate transport system permease protein [Arthrobacter sp. cf158]|uniref:amino acid ABC transporter permease n=1 Tax=Arthrobacter sp. cf158 TaxID=1761744 RepID=UPI000898F055|nr:amino acid ABC transporter permease [Arthrobacter sp. cf158]SDX50468.1 glutamate transport system permease protein [Arthrobacter sp. cf158]
MNIIFDNLDLWGLALWNTLVLFIGGAVIAVFLGTVLGVMRVSSVPAARAIGTAYVNLVRNTPLTLVFFIFVFGYPSLGLPRLDYTALAITAIGLYAATYVTEVLRSGFNTIPVGQAEAARALGMTFGQVMGHVVLPQAFRSVVPPLISALIAILKMTTIAAGFSVLELGAVRANLSERGENALGVLLWVALVFVLLVAIMSLAQRSLEKKWKIIR